MRNLNRNERTIYYALYTGETEQLDSNSLYTGEVVASYSTPVALNASVSASRGTADLDLFGINTSYTKTVIVDDIDCPIDEHSRLWIDREPTDGNGLPVAHNYEVVQVAKSLNHIAYAVQQIDFGLSEVISG